MKCTWKDFVNSLSPGEYREWTEYFRTLEFSKQINIRKDFINNAKTLEDLFDLITIDVDYIPSETIKVTNIDRDDI